MNNKNSIRFKLDKLVIILVIISMITLLVIMECALFYSRKHAEQSLIEQTLVATETYADGKTQLNDSRLESIVGITEHIAESATYLYRENVKLPLTHIKAVDDYDPVASKNKLTFHYNTFTGDGEKSPAVLEELGILEGIVPQLEIIQDNNPAIVNISIYTTSGISLGYDKNVSDKIGGHGFNPEALGKDYYIIPKTTGKSHLTDAYRDAYGRGLMITVASPIFLDGKIIGVAAADALVEDINKIICSDDTPIEGGYKVLLNKSGELLTINNMKDGDTIETVFGDSSEKIKSISATNADGYFLTNVKGEDVYVMHQKLNCGWIFLVVLPYKGIIEPASKMTSISRYANLAAALAAIILLIIMVNVARNVCGKLISPLETLTNKVGKVTGDNLDFKANIDTGDEVEMLDKRFEEATEKMKEYVENITTITAEKERISTELNVATKIQADMLPSIFPAFPDRPEFDIYATMTPAKEVGGDFYDLFMIDDDHLCMVMADVSGKGVPAALFMVIAKTLIKNQAKTCLVPSKILEAVNDQLCENNTSSMFVTVWLGIMEISTGKIITANAGHEFPAIKQPNGKFELVKDKHGFVLAGMENAKYKDCEFHIGNGGALFIYTDGIPEATNSHDELFGNDRMVEALNSDDDITPHNVTKRVRAAVDTFVGDAPQFDDLTMLCIKRT